jgi:hypothetical protein
MHGLPPENPFCRASVDCQLELQIAAHRFTKQTLWWQPTDLSVDCQFPCFRFSDFARFSPHFVIAQKDGCAWSEKAKFRNGTPAALDEGADVGRLGLPHGKLGVTVWKVRRYRVEIPGLPRGKLGVTPSDNSAELLAYVLHRSMGYR